MVNVFVVPIESSTFHWHEEYEMIGVLKGSILVRVQSEVIHLHEGDVILVNSNIIHAIQGRESEENLCMFLQINPKLMDLQEEDKTELRFYLDSTSDEKPTCGYSYFFRKMALIIFNTMSDDKHAVFRVRADACGLIADLFDYVVYDVRFRDATVQNNRELTISIISYFETHLAEEKIMELVCHEFGISRKTLDRNVKMTIGISGKEIVDSLRLEKAKQMLKTTNKNMNYILDCCGFGSEKSFYRIFRQETGLTPKEFREKGLIMHKNDVLKGYLHVRTTEAKEILRKILCDENSENKEKECNT